MLPARFITTKIERVNISVQMIEKAYFDGQWFWTRQNAHQIDDVCLHLIVQMHVQFRENR